ncbi:hypothetical protein JTF24_13855 [Priestia megaterium]|nr:hypothetical protein [Priestia megaterium]
MFERNKEIRQLKGNLPIWVIAEKLGIHENTLYRKLRKELHESEKKEIIKIIKSLKATFKEEE